MERPSLVLTQASVQPATSKSVSRLVERPSGGPVEKNWGGGVSNQASQATDRDGTFLTMAGGRGQD